MVRCNDHDNEEDRRVGKYRRFRNITIVLVVLIRSGLNILLSRKKIGEIQFETIEKLIDSSNFWKNGTAEGVDDATTESSFGNESMDVIGIPSGGDGESEDDDDSFAHAYSARADYTWKSNRWIPPEDVPYLFPRDIRRFFRSENTIWWGDSTGRQDYHTTYWLMLSSSQNNTDDNIIGLDIADKKLLERDKNKAKKAPVNNTEFHCPARIIPEESTSLFLDLGQVIGTDENCSVATMESVTTTTGGTPWSKFSLNNQATGKFDYANTKCFNHVKSDLEKHKEMVKREYSVLIVSAGIWEAIRPDICSNATGVVSKINDPSKNLVDLLDYLQKLSGPSFFVIWKTNGPSNKMRKRMVQNDNVLASVARNWFSENQPLYMDLADFRWAIRNRSSGSDRIIGDLHAHFGLEARLLSIEVISHIVNWKQKRNERTSVRTNYTSSTS